MQDAGYYTLHGGEHDGKPYLKFPNREVASSWLCDILDLWVGRERPTAAALLTTCTTAWPLATCTALPMAWKPSSTAWRTKS